MKAWPTVPLGEICSINPRLGRSEHPSDDARVSFVPMAAVDEVEGAIAAPEIRCYRSVAKGYTAFREGDVLFAKITPCMENGKAALAENLIGGLGFGSTEFHVLRPGPLLDRRLLFHWIRTPEFKRRAKAHFTGTAGQQRVPPTFLENVTVPLPPLDEQRRIVDILDRAASIRRLRRQAQQTARQIIPALFVKMFSDPRVNQRAWPIVPLDRVADVASGVTKGRRLNGTELVEVPYLRVANVQDGFLDLTEVKTIQLRPTELDRFRLQPGDLLMTEGGDPDKLGRGAIWTGELPYCAHQNHVFRVRADRSRILPNYLACLSGSLYGKNYFLQVAKRTTGIASINKTQLSAFPVVLPPLALQHEFDLRFESVTRLIDRQSSAEMTSRVITQTVQSRLLG